MTGSGVAWDVYQYLLSLLFTQKGIQQNYTTPGNSTVTIKLVENTGWPVPRITVLNTGLNTAYIGYGMVTPTTGFPLVAGASQTLTFKNARALQLVACDGGTSTTLSVIG
jgi:hypothetical protein